MTTKPGSLAIEPLTEPLLSLLEAHIARHRAESGADGQHFMPFAPSDPDGPRGIDRTRWQWPLTRPGWQRWFVACDDGRVVGHVDLKGSELRAAAHRAVLGIGMEAPYRGGGLGRRLMERTIRFCREAEPLAWLDLQVFAGNEPALALYRALGFQELGRLPDRFRIDGQSIDDVYMALAVGP